MFLYYKEDDMPDMAKIENSLLRYKVILLMTVENAERVDILFFLHSVFQMQTSDKCLAFFLHRGCLTRLDVPRGEWLI
jgi:hypothetical protein